MAGGVGVRRRMELLNAARNDPHTAIACTGEPPAFEWYKLRNRDIYRTFRMDRKKTIAVNPPTVPLRIRSAAKTLIQRVCRANPCELALSQLKITCVIV